MNEIVQVSRGSALATGASQSDICEETYPGLVWNSLTTALCTQEVPVML